jgi:hypothetical protein
MGLRVLGRDEPKAGLSENPDDSPGELATIAIQGQPHF